MNPYARKQFFISACIFSAIAISWIFISFVIAIPVMYIDQVVFKAQINIMDAFWIVQYIFNVFFAILWLRKKKH